MKFGNRDMINLLKNPKSSATTYQHETCLLKSNPQQMLRCYIYVACQSNQHINYSAEVQEFRQVESIRPVSDAALTLCQTVYAC